MDKKSSHKIRKEEKQPEDKTGRKALVDKERRQKVRKEERLWWTKKGARR
jgi:hypothetical protein